MAVIIKYTFSIENKSKSLTISDNGLGIDLEKYGNSLFGIYKTFYRTKKPRGLGLLSTKNQAEAMNGTVIVKAKVGVGTTFKILFIDSLTF